MKQILVIALASLLYTSAYPQQGSVLVEKMFEAGLVDIQSLDSDILVDLKYSSTDNFVGKDMYGELEQAFLEPEFANRVVKAQQLLKQRHPDYTLLIYDAARPTSVQRAMRKTVECS